MEPQTKGTVTPIASLFSEDEARKAASYVEVKIGEKREEMNRLQQFVVENDSLIKKLPDQLHHNVMVPFGKIAFFPGRLIHTNECLVFLGENYYTDRTSKQTVDILKRRDKTLQSQIHSLKAEIEDFQTEASFFTTTASEAAEGLLEIREEYEEEEEEDSTLSVLQPGVKKEPSSLLGGETTEGEIEDDDFARIMSRLNELEMEEEQEGEDGDDRSEEHVSSVENVEESEDDMVKGLGDKTNHNRIDYDESAAKQESTITISVLEKVSGHSSSIRVPIYSEPRVKPKGMQVLPEKHPHKDFQATSSVSKAKADSSVVGPQKIESPIQKPEPKFDTNKAFTGSIVEHTHNLETNTHGPLQPPGSKPSKPVSRFKAQRR